jgi:chromosome segregation ATPase
MVTLKQQLEDATKELDDKDEYISSLESDVKAKDEKIAKLEQDVKEKEGEIKELKKSNSVSKQQLVEKLEHRILSLESDLTKKNDELKNLRAALDSSGRTTKKGASESVATKEFAAVIDYLEKGWLKCSFC